MDASGDAGELPTHNVAGTLVGLANGKTIVLSDNGGDNRELTANGVFTFSTPLAEGAHYQVAVAIQPLGQTSHGSVRHGND